MLPRPACGGKRDLHCVQVASELFDVFISLHLRITPVLEHGALLIEQSRCILTMRALACILQIGDEAGTTTDMRKMLAVKRVDVFARLYNARAKPNIHYLWTSRTQMEGIRAHMSCGSHPKGATGSSRRSPTTPASTLSRNCCPKAERCQP